MNDPADFDAWYAETAEDTVPLRLLGRVWQIPADAPAAAILRLQRLERFVQGFEPGDEVPDDIDLEQLGYEPMTRSMIGSDLLDEWLAAGVKTRQLQMLTRRLYLFYTGVIAAEQIIPAAPPQESDEQSGEQPRDGDDDAGKETSSAG